MFKKIGRLFVIKTKFEAYLIIYAFATGAVERGKLYLVAYPGFGGKLLFVACFGAVMLGGAKMLDAIELSKMRDEWRARNDSNVRPSDS